MKQTFVAFEPKIWGPQFWKVIYYILFSFDATSEVSKDFVELFFYALGGLIPCGECQEHFHSYFEKNNIKDFLSTKEEIFHWVYMLQKEIQSRTNSPFPSSFEEWFHHLRSQHEFSQH
jgi:hypothetical protein|tara:strand:+ start:34 stop:387 length:354 start_codon:yes stop_codon:yes gene_type:complete